MMSAKAVATELPGDCYVPEPLLLRHRRFPEVRLRGAGQPPESEDLLPQVADSPAADEAPSANRPGSESDARGGTATRWTASNVRRNSTQAAVRTRSGCPAPALTPVPVDGAQGCLCCWQSGYQYFPVNSAPAADNAVHLHTQVEHSAAERSATLQAGEQMPVRLPRCVRNVYLRGQAGLCPAIKVRRRYARINLTPSAVLLLPDTTCPGHNAAGLSVQSGLADGATGFSLMPVCLCPALRYSTARIPCHR